MSNDAAFAGPTNESTALSRIFAAVPMFGYALAMGKDTFADVGDRLFRGALSDPSIEPEITVPLYRDIRSHAEAVGIAKRKPMKDQSDKSRASQASKLAVFVKLAAFAQSNDGVIPAYEEAQTLATGGYTKLVKGLVAANKALAKRPNIAAPDLLAIVRAAFVKAPELVSASVLDIRDQWDALTEDEAHATEFAALLAAFPADYVRHIGQSLTEIAKFFEAREKAREPVRLSGLSE